MNSNLAVVSFLAGLGSLGLALAARGGVRTEEDALLKALPKSKHSLADGVQQVSKSPETAISAKFELEEEEGEDKEKEKNEKEEEGGELSLSVYTAEKGLGVDAEHNVLKEYAGGPEAALWKP